MSKYFFNKEEEDLLKVAKYNQTKSERLLSELKELNAAAQAKNDANEKFIREMEEKFGIKVPTFTSAITELPSVEKNIVPLKNWDELVAEANEAIPEYIDFEDLLTQNEITNALKDIDRINEQFSKKTRLKKIDILFLAVATALQCTRQYIIDPWLKSHRLNADSSDEKGRKGNAEAGWYYVDTDKILTNRVPFDAQGYSKHSSVQGFLKGGNHRQVTLGHDPLLGWVFGTANILTNTITRHDFASAHIKYEAGKGNIIHSLADTGKVFTACKDRLLDEGTDGKIAVGSAVIREAIHLKSDVNTSMSLPIPIISTVSLEFARRLASYGIDTAGVGTEMGLSLVINTLISMVHRLFFDESIDDKKLYEVRTRKILLYSNIIASTSNIIISIISKNPKKLDVGGLIVTIMRLFSDIRFITNIKKEFIQSSLDINFQGIKSELDEMYKQICL